jgi:hypothetical protein
MTSNTTDLAFAVLELLRLGEMNAGAKRDPDLTTETRQQIWVKYRDARNTVKKMAEKIAGIVDDAD